MYERGTTPDQWSAEARVRPAQPSTTLNYEETMLVRRALGLERSRTVCRNQVACHVGGSDIQIAQPLQDKGVLTRDEDADFGSMRVFRVTEAGARAIGKKLPASPTH